MIHHSNQEGSSLDDMLCTPPSPVTLCPVSSYKPAANFPVNSNGEPRTLPASYAVVFKYQYSTNFKMDLPPIGVGTGEGGGQWRQGPPPPTQYFTLETLLISYCSANRHVTVYITFGPPKMELLPTPMHFDSI